MNLNSHKNTCFIKYGVLTLRGSGRAWLTVSVIRYKILLQKNKKCRGKTLHTHNCNAVYLYSMVIPRHKGNTRHITCLMWQTLKRSCASFTLHHVLSVVVQQQQQQWRATKAKAERALDETQQGFLINAF